MGSFPFDLNSLVRLCPVIGYTARPLYDTLPALRSLPVPGSISGGAGVLGGAMPATSRIVAVSSVTCVKPSYGLRGLGPPGILTIAGVVNPPSLVKPLVID